MDYSSQQPQEVSKLVTSAAEQGNCEIIGQILDAGVGASEADSTGQTPLMASKNREVAEFLIQRGADVNREIEGINGSDTTLGYVIQNRDCKDKSTVELCKVLIDNGASVNYRNGEDKTPLMLIAAQDDCVDMLQMLLDNGSDVNDKDSEGNTALFHAVKRNNSMYVTCLIDCTRDKKGLINIQNKKGITPFILSVRKRNVPIVKKLIENGADVNIKDNKENTALHHLLFYHRNIEEILTFLLEAGSQVNRQNSNGISPLMLAARKTMPSVLSSLLDAGADVNAVSKKNNSKTALSFLSHFEFNLRNKTRLSIETLLDRGASGTYLGPECIHKLIIGNHVNTILKLIQHGVGPADGENIQREIAFPYLLPPMSPLFFALLLDKVHIARYFVDILFLTSSDLSMFAFNKAIKYFLYQYFIGDSLRFLQEISSQPMSLVKLSLVTVSAAVGSSPGRETRVDLLPLPQLMKDMLLFKSVGGEHSGLAEILSESNTPVSRSTYFSLLTDTDFLLYSSDERDYPSDSDDDYSEAYLVSLV